MSRTDCKWSVIYPEDPKAKHLMSGCGHALYIVTPAVKSFKICPWCGLKINKEVLGW